MPLRSYVIVLFQHFLSPSRESHVIGIRGTHPSLVFWTERVGDFTTAICLRRHPLFKAPFGYTTCRIYTTFILYFCIVCLAYTHWSNWIRVFAHDSSSLIFYIIICASSHDSDIFTHPFITPYRKSFLHLYVSQWHFVLLNKHLYRLLCVLFLLFLPLTT